MSIQTDLTRIKNAKAAIKAAIEGKGVTVPEATLLDGMASLIESIEAGGGGLQNNRMVSVANGSFTVSERTEISRDNRFILQHDCGVIPLLILIRASKCSADSDLKDALFWRLPNPYNSKSSCVWSLITRRATSSYYYEAVSSESGSVSGNNWTTEHVSLVAYNTTAYFNTGITYNWSAYYAE